MAVIAGWNQAGAAASRDQPSKVASKRPRNSPIAEWAIITSVLYTSALAASFSVGALSAWDAAQTGQVQQTNEEWKWLTDCHINSPFVRFCSDNVSEDRRILRRNRKIDARWLWRELDGHVSTKMNKDFIKLDKLEPSLETREKGLMILTHLHTKNRTKLYY